MHFGTLFQLTVLSSLFPPKTRHLTVCQNNSSPFYLITFQSCSFPGFTSQWQAAQRAPIKPNVFIRSFLFPFRAYCCPSGEVINGFIMYESVIPSVCCLIWIAQSCSSFMPSMLTVRRYCKAVLLWGFFPLYSITVYQNYVTEAPGGQKKKSLHPLQKGS